MNQCQWCCDNLFDNDTPGLPKGEPQKDCSLVHWKLYAEFLKGERDLAVARLEMHDDDRDKMDVAEWLEHHKKTKTYRCTGCQRLYEIPPHLIHITCVCGLRCRLRHIGGTDPNEAVIDAAMAYFGNERMAQIAYLAESFVKWGKSDPDQVRIFREQVQYEMDRWERTNDGWRKK